MYRATDFRVGTENMREPDMTRDMHCWLRGGVWSSPEGVVLRGRSEYLKRA
jgi:hypothetical protein